MNARLLTALLGLSALPAVIVAQTPTVTTPLRLMRCARGVDAACLQARVVLDAENAAAAGAIDSVREPLSWSGSLGQTRLLGPAVRLSREIAPPLRLVVLVDLSYSMHGSKVANVRTAIRADVLRDLDSASARVAVIGFDGRRVQSSIDTAHFVSPYDADRALERMRDPEPNAATGLYSAIVAAADRLDRELRAAHGAQGAILLVTDGGNDVRGGDAGLLDGVVGYRLAASAANAPFRRTWILGVGHKIARDTLRLLAGSPGRFIEVDSNLVAIAGELATIVREFRGARELTFGAAEGDAMALARAPATGVAELRDHDSTLVRRELTWRPPLFALPAYEGVIDSASVPQMLRESLRTGAQSGRLRWFLALAFALTGVLFGALAPRLIWIRTADPEEATSDPAEIVMPKAAPAKANPAPAPVAFAGGLRQDVTEVAPRRAGDITAQTARQV